MLAEDILDCLPDPAAVTDPQGYIRYRNSAWREAALDPGQPGTCATLAACLVRAEPLRTQENGRPDILRLDKRVFEHRVAPITKPLPGLDAAVRHEMHLLRDITESWHLAEERHFIERLYRTLSFCNQALVRAQDERELAQGVCNGLVQHGGYRYCTVSVWLDGKNTGYWQIAWSSGENLPEEIIRRLHQISRDFIDAELAHLLTRPADARRHSVDIPANEFGTDSATPLAIECYPLINAETGLGALIVASTPSEFNRTQEFGLIEELAGDLAFGLETLRLRATAARLETEHTEHIQRERDQLAATVEAIAALVEMRDAYTAGHQRRVRRLALRLGELLGLAKDRLDGLAFAAGIHDIGKIQVPAEILAKPSRLSSAEFEIIKAHPEAGAATLAPIVFPWPVAEIIRQHHERMDGSGYPRGLRGDEILLEARILAVADIVEAMSTHRPYRPAHPLLDTFQFLRQQRGIQLDAAVVDACLHLLIEERFKVAEGDN